MLTYIDVLNAANRLNGWRDGFAWSETEKQLVNSLRVYLQRGDYDGTMASAYHCLELAGYELKNPYQDEERLKNGRL
jgi:hypothetical protein